MKKENHPELKKSSFSFCGLEIQKGLSCMLLAQDLYEVRWRLAHNQWEAGTTERLLGISLCSYSVRPFSCDHSTLHSLGYSHVKLEAATGLT